MRQNFPVGVPAPIVWFMQQVKGDNCLGTYFGYPWQDRSFTNSRGESRVEYTCLR